MRTAPISLALVMIGAASAFGADSAGGEIEGKAILKNHCARCHSIGASGESPLHKAPPLREIYLRYPIEQLSQGLAEGMGSRHRGMPQIQFSSEEVTAILYYLGNITGIAPTERIVVEPDNADQRDPP
jgi:mono/diheme cytochrome c family protein